jgi:DNA-binding IscR family transcriptional regulator
VITLVEGANSTRSASATATSPVARVLQEKWQEVASTEARMLESTTFAELAEQVQDAADPMYYI